VLFSGESSFRFPCERREGYGLEYDGLFDLENVRGECLEAKDLRGERLDSKPLRGERLETLKLLLAVGESALDGLFGLSGESRFLGEYDLRCGEREAGVNRVRLSLGALSNADALRFDDFEPALSEELIANFDNEGSPNKDS